MMIRKFNTKPVLQMILKGLLHTEIKINIAMKEWKLLNLKRRPGK
jgi:hypothetical protein